jgi:hypothetical protein
MIDAMKQALEALEDARNGTRIEYNDQSAYQDEITALRQAIEQAEKQEPVAWMRDDGTLLFADGNVFAVGQAFYTAPLKREWVGLTGLEVSHYNSRLSRSGVAEEIQAKLRERNT